ncbi:hypothetical protein, partial [Streptomyces sp. NPDC002690]
MRLGLGIVGAAWAVVVLVDAGLVRAQVLHGTDTWIATGAGLVAGVLAHEIWFGGWGTPHVATVDGRPLLSARTLTGVRTIELDALSSVRRFSAFNRSGGTLDELHLRDRYGLRLTIGHDTRAEVAVRRAVVRADARPSGAQVEVTRHARGRLGLNPQSAVPGSVHALFGVGLSLAVLLLPALGSYTVACFLACLVSRRGCTVVNLPGPAATSSPGAGGDSPAKP